MTLLFLESFDHHGSTDANMNSTLTRKHSSFAGTWENEVGVISTTSGGTNNQGDQFNIDLGEVKTEIIVGFAVKFREANQDANDPFIRFLNGGGFQIADFHRGHGAEPRFLSHSNVTYRVNAIWKHLLWNYFEIRILAGTNDSNGELEMYLNGKNVFNQTGIDTFHISPGVRYITFDGSDHFDQLYDNIYVVDTEGTTNNTFLGEIQVEAIFPNAAGTTTDWTATGAATNHEATDDIQFDDDTSYVSSSTVGEKDTYNFDNLTNITQGIVGIQMLPNGKKVGTGTREIVPVVRSGGTDYDQTMIDLTTSYDYYPTILETDPDTSSAWTASGINSAEFGYKVSV